MSVALPESRHSKLIDRFLHRDSLALQLLVAIVVTFIISLIFGWADIWPKQWIIPIKVWISELFRWLDKEASLGLFTVKQLTRSIAWILKQPLIWFEYILWKGARPHQFLPVLWIGIATIVAVVAHRMRGTRFAVIVTAALLTVVIIDAIPFILLSLSKALRVDPWMEAPGFCRHLSNSCHHSRCHPDNGQTAANPVDRDCSWFWRPWTLGWRLAARHYRRSLHELSGLHGSVARIHENIFACRRGCAVLRHCWAVARCLGHPLKARRSDHYANLRFDAGNPASGVSGTRSRDVRRRAGAGFDRHCDLCHAANGAVYNSGNPNGAQRHH